MNPARARAARTAIAATIAFAGGVIIMANQFAPCVHPAPCTRLSGWQNKTAKRTRSKHGGIIIIIVCIRYNTILVALALQHSVAWDKEIAASLFDVFRELYSI